MNGRRSGFRALTGRSARAALLTTTGHLDAPVIREGGRIEIDQLPRPCRKPYAPHAVTLKMADRIVREMCGRYVSLEWAWQVYGIIMAPNGQVDLDVTALQRARLAGRSSGGKGMADG